MQEGNSYRVCYPTSLIKKAFQIKGVTFLKFEPNELMQAVVKIGVTECKNSHNFQECINMRWKLWLISSEALFRKGS